MPTDGPPLPDPKARTLARGPRRYRRHVASRAEWGELRAAKDGPCRICESAPPNELHHLISRARGGNDEADNLVPLCVVCHDRVTTLKPEALADLLDALTDAEYAKVETFGVTRVFSGALS